MHDSAPETAAQDPMVRVQGLSKRFGENVVFDGLDLAIDRGETRVIIGGSGTGKSVLLKHLAGLLSADAGSVQIAGVRVDLTDSRSVAVLRDNVGMLFQGGALFDSMTIRENVGFSIDQHPGDLDATQIDERVRQALEMVNLADIQHLYPADISGGMQKRVALARALVAQPAVMLYDEPTTGLDPINANVINLLIRDVQRRLGVTGLVVTHDMDSAFMVADRISMLHEGRILQTATPDEIRDTNDPIVKRFINGTVDPSDADEAGQAV